jgi:hypothetical protein
MKPLELIKQGGQLPRPKPPVEQRVKVMDTLDKKMQTILEREDLSADEIFSTILYFFQLIFH